MSLRSYGHLALIGLIAALGLVVLGGVVRVSGSGLGCPDWPLCHGKIVPPFNLPTLIEYSHRLLAILVSILVLVIAGFAWLAFRKQLDILLFANLALALLIAQVVLGAVTVLGELQPSIVTLHLAVAEFLLGSLTALYVIVRRSQTPYNPQLDVSRPSRLTMWFVGSVLVSTAVVILSGAYVRSTGATGACYSWPLCGPEGLPFHGLLGIHMAHRIVTLLAFILIVATLVYVRRHMAKAIWAKRLTHGVCMLFGLQGVVGLIVVNSGFTPFTRAVHIALASLVWIVAVALTARAWQARIHGR